MSRIRMIESVNIATSQATKLSSPSASRSSASEKISNPLIVNNQQRSLLNPDFHAGEAHLLR